MDIETRRWEKIALPGPMPTPRTNQKAVLVSQSRIVIFGGFTAVPWSSAGGYKSDNTAFLFSFTIKTAWSFIM